MSCSQLTGQQLSENDLGVLVEELNNINTKWNNLGLQLGVSVGTMNSIKKDCNGTSDCLRETLTIWLKTCPSPPSWNNIVDALRCRTVGEVRLAADLEQKYCSMHETGIAATHLHTSPAPSQADTAMTSQQSQSQAHATPAPQPPPLSQALTWMTPPTQYTIPPMQPPVLAYSVTPPSYPSPWSVPYYYSPHTSYPLYTPFPLTPLPSGAASASVHPSYPQPSQVTPTSSRPLLPSVPAQPTTSQLPTTLYPSPPSLTTIPPDTSSTQPLAIVTTPPHLPPPVTAHTLGMKVLSHLHEIRIFCAVFHLKSILLNEYIATCTLIVRVLKQ